MTDVLFVLATAGFFLLAAGYVVFCNRLIGEGDATPGLSPSREEGEG